MADIKDKIKKLLALAQSPNENEARDALLKAKEIMAKHKISQDDISGDQKQLVHIVCDSVKWTTDSGNSWMVGVVDILCNNYCCVGAWQTPRGCRTHTLCITGVQNDANVCKCMIEYAIGFIQGKTKILSKKHRDAKAAVRSYVEGFTLGLELAFEEQKEQHAEWGLVLVKSQEVQDYEDSLSNKKVTTKKCEFNPLAYLQGQNDGMNFDKIKSLEVTA